MKPIEKTESDPILSLCVEITKKLPDPFNIEHAEEKFPTEYTNSMNTVLRQELKRYNDLLAFIKDSLSDIHRAILGQIVMIPELEKAHSEMSLGKIPSSWKKKSYPSLKPLGSYINDLLARIKFFKTWLNEGEPIVYWFTGFFFTQCFLTGVLQNHARRKSLPIDSLEMKFEITRFEKYDHDEAKAQFQVC